MVDGHRLEAVWFNDGRIPLLFEALPTDAEFDRDGREFHLDMLRPLRTMGVAAVNVPEIIGGHYRTVDPTAFAAGVQETTGLPTVVNRITVQEPAAGLDRWVDAAAARGVDHYVFVGGESSQDAHVGPSVTQALEATRPRLGDHQTVGCITIPTRRRPVLDEPERLLRKHAAGADFAISQILGESVSAADLQRDTAQHALEHDATCIPLFWSLSPIVRTKDIRFLEWLGVQIPRPYRQALHDAGTRDARLRTSHRTNESMVRNLLEHAEHEDHGPIGFCIEHVMRSNMAPAFELVERVRDVCREFRAAPLAR